MITKDDRKSKTRKRHFRLRKKVLGTQERPRLSVYKSNKHIYAQIINDIESCTLASYSTLQDDLESTWTIEAAKKIGEALAKSAVSKGIKKVVFDSGGNKYHGKISALAEGAREGGLEF
jgi:large subunit ribosomal protein L18